MLSLFPSLLSFGILAPFLLRVSLGIIFIYISYLIIYKDRKDFFSYYKKNKYPFPEAVTSSLGILTLLTGIFFIIGFLVQAVSIVSIYLLISISFCDSEIKKLSFGKPFYFLSIIVSLSLILLGAGSFAVDLPL